MIPNKEEASQKTASIMAALEQAMSMPLSHGIFRLEVIYRDGQVVRYVTHFEQSHKVA